MFFVLVVLYNKRLAASKTLQGILSSSDLLNDTRSTLLLWDNSEYRMAESELTQLSQSFKFFQYRHTPKNLSLSTIYNLTIEETLTSEARYLVLLDDDSNINSTYFSSALKVVGEYSLMLPVVFNQQKVKSPMRYYILKSFHFKHVPRSILSSKNLMAINSGMMIATEFLRMTGFRYHQQLRNYGTDNYFMNFYAKHRTDVLVLDYSFSHSLSFFDSSSIQKKLSVLRETKKANLLVHENSLWETALVKAYNFLTSLKYALRYKSFHFFK